MDHKWHVIKSVLLVLVCVFGLVTCSAIEVYENLRSKELEVETLKAQAEKAHAEALKAKILSERR